MSQTKRRGLGRGLDALLTKPSDDSAENTGEKKNLQAKMLNYKIYR